MTASRWPLWLQLACATAAASVVVAVAAGYFMRAIETDYLRDELRRESFAAAQALSTGMSSVRNADGSYELAKLEERARRGDAQIFSLALHDRDGREITRWVSSRVDAKSGAERGSLDEVIYFRVPTPIPGQSDAQLVVSWNVSEQLNRIEQHVERIRSNVFVAIALLSGLLVLLVDFLVVRPVSALREGLDRLVRGGSSHVVSLSRFAASELARLAHSVRELGHYQHELRDAQDSLVEARKQAELASEAKGRFLAVMSHEIRTPMNGVLGNLELLDDKQLNNSQRALVGNAKRAADSLLEIINEILDFSRVESGRLELESNEFPIEELLHDVASSISGLLNSAEVELVVDFDPGLPEKLLGDPLRLRQVLTNLLGNAAKFTSSGDIVLQASLESGPQLQLTVRDSGIGIDPGQLSLLFEPFTQADSSISRHYGGTGLGLSITRRLVELMGGEISVESGPGKGSLFRVRLPLQVCAPPRVYAEPSNWLSEAPLTSAPRNRVMVVTGNNHTGAALARSLGSMGLVPLCVEDASAAREAIGESGLSLLALIVDPPPALAASSPALSAALRNVLDTSGVRIMVLLPAGVAIPPDMARDTSILKPVKRAELFAALSGPQPGAEAAQAGGGGVDSTAISVLGDVLLVDDNPMNVQVAQAMLERLSLTVVAADSGERALAHLAERDFDVVLMDEQMPGMDGLEATRILREREQLAMNVAEEGKAVRTIVVALTANADSESQQRCLAAGMDGFLAKPVRRKALRAMLARWISNLPAESAADGG